MDDRERVLKLIAAGDLGTAQFWIDRSRRLGSLPANILDALQEYLDSERSAA